MPLVADKALKAYKMLVFTDYKLQILCQIITASKFCGRSVNEALFARALPQIHTLFLCKCKVCKQILCSQKHLKKAKFQALAFIYLTSSCFCKGKSKSPCLARVLLACLYHTKR